MEALRALYNRLRFLFTQFSLGKWNQLSKLELVLVYPVRLVVQVFRELVQDRGLVRASSLAFTTALSVVPLLTVATTLMTAFGGSNSRFMEFLQTTFLPFAGPEITSHIQSFVTNQSGAISGVGAVILIFLGVALFHNIEHAFNDIWRVKKRRPLLNKFLTFYALITLAPLLVTVSIVQSAQLHIMVQNLPIPFFASLGYKLVPVGLGALLFTLGNKLLPYTKVRWAPAMISGLVTAAAFELAKTGFNYYITEFVLENYSRVYGALGLIPIFLIWVYVSWVLVLFGAELTYTIQNLKTLLLPQRLRDLEERRDKHFSPVVAIEVFTPIAEAFKKGTGPVTADHVAGFAGCPLELVRTVVGELRDAGIVLEVAGDNEQSTASYYPAKPLADITLLDLLQSCRRNRDGTDDAPIVASLKQVFHAQEQKVFGGLTAEVLAGEDGFARLRALLPAIGLEELMAEKEKPNPLKKIAKALASRPEQEARNPIDRLIQLRPNGNAETEGEHAEDDDDVGLSRSGEVGAVERADESEPDVQAG